MPENISPEHFQKMDQQLQKLVKEMIGVIQAEIKRLEDKPSDSSANASLYIELGKKAAFVKDQVVSPDFTIALEGAINKLKEAQELSSRQAKNEAVLSVLKEVCVNLHGCRNVRG